MAVHNKPGMENALGQHIHEFHEENLTLGVADKEHHDIKPLDEVDFIHKHEAFPHSGRKPTRKLSELFKGRKHKKDKLAVHGYRRAVLNNPELG